MLAAFLCSLHPQAQTGIEEMTQQQPDPVVEIKTTLGDIKVRLYNDTPLHRDNFLKLVGEGFYDGVLFHRVIDGFMVQTGDPDSREAAKGAQLGGGDPGYTIEAEIDYPRHYHKYGALAAARTGDNVNPERRSSGSQFYIVTGATVSEQELEARHMRGAEMRMQAYFQGLVRENGANRGAAESRRQGRSRSPASGADQADGGER